MVRSRIPETCEVETDTIGVFSRVAGWTGYGAAWRVRGIMGEPFQPGEMVVDVGTGPGTIPLHLQRMFPEVRFHGLDLGLPMLAEAGYHARRMKISLPLICADGTVLPFQDKSLDMVLSFFCMHHINDPGAFLQEIDRVLKEDGKLLILDFKRDIPAVLDKGMNLLWKLGFIFSSGKNGLKESIDSAWTREEIMTAVKDRQLARFLVHETRTELLVTAGIKKFHGDVQ
jgi:demethylmenaquinone methyltransferase/2-methoxy-6-polyprenyl-1,4-benzoquinol methylase